MKGKIKKVFAVGASVALLATTMVGALADLSNYPAPFVDEDGVFDGAIVVGETAATMDVLGAIDIAASLQADAKKAVAGGSGAATVEGGEDFTLALNTGWTAQTLDDGDLEGFKDDDVRFNDADYDFHEEIVLPGGDVDIVTSLASTYAEDKDYGLDPYMELDNLVYKMVFDDPVPVANIGTGTGKDELDISLAGKALKIISADGSDGITVETSNEYYMIEGDVKTINGHEVTLVSVGDSAVIVDVDGDTQPISSAEGTVTFEDANDFEVDVGTIFYRDGGTTNGASLTLGSSLTDSYEHGDALEIFDGEDDLDYATWKWHINDNGTHLIELGAELNMHYYKLESDPGMDDRNALAMGEEFFFPNNYASIVFAGWDDSAMGQYDTLEISFEQVDLKDANGDDYATPLDDAYVVVFESSADEPFIVGTEDTNTVYVHWNATSAAAEIYYDDGEDNILASESYFGMILDQDLVNVTIGDGATDWTIDFADGSTLDLAILNSSSRFEFLGTAEGEDDGDVEFAFTDAVLGTVGDADDEEVYTSYGLYWTDTESMVEDDNIVLNVPHDGQVAQIIVKARGTTVSAGSVGDAYMVRPIEVGLGMLDTEATLGSKPMIVVGGPYANDLAAELLGNPTPEEIGETFTDGKAMIKWFEDEQAILVAGWSAQDTLGGAYALADYAEYGFEGSELEVVVSSLDNLVVNTVN